MKKIVTFCDMCVDMGNESPDDVETYTITINGKTVIVDLCEECHVTWIENVFDSLLAVSTVPSKKIKVNTKVSSEIVRCNDCKRDFSPHGYKTHRTTMHKTVKPLAVVKDTPPLEGEFICDHKGCARTFTRAQALGLHKFRTHGVKGTTRKAS